MFDFVVMAINKNKLTFYKQKILNISNTFFLSKKLNSLAISIKVIKCQLVSLKANFL